MLARTFSRRFFESAPPSDASDADGHLDVGISDMSNEAALEADAQLPRTRLQQAGQRDDSATDYAVITMTLTGHITGWTVGARSILGYEETDILGRSGDVFFPAEDRDRGAFLNALDCAMQHGCAVNEGWHLKQDGTRFWASGSIMPLRDPEGSMIGYLNVFRDTSGGRAVEERRALLIMEMNHRLKNLLATVQAVAAQTLRAGKVPREVQDNFDARLVALARSHDLLVEGDWEGASLVEIVERALAPYENQGRVTISGPSLRLPTPIVEMLCLAFHEMATNAAKHGALSVPEGRVDVCWTVERDGSGTRTVEIAWREHDGPPVVPPAGRGFGSRLLEHGLPHSFGGAVALKFPISGLECRISLPLSAMFAEICPAA